MPDRMRLLDLFCGAGGAAVGYARAGFDVVGVDSADRLAYPFERRVADALDYLDAGGWLGFDVIHASPPCQAYTSLARDKWRTADQHPDLIAPLRERLLNIGLSYVIENIPTAPLLDPLELCGSMFGLPIRRHRHFEIRRRDADDDRMQTRTDLILTPAHAHDRARRVVGVYGHAGGRSTRDGDRHSTADWRAAMGIDWMNGAELAEAIPPAYTEWIGRNVL